MRMLDLTTDRRPPTSGLSHHHHHHHHHQQQQQQQQQKHKSRAALAGHRNRTKVSPAGCCCQLPLPTEPGAMANVTVHHVS